MIDFSASNLELIKKILSDFEIISGLGCNIEKTAVMQIGSNDPVPVGIINLGFEIKKEIVLLGAKIKNSGISYEENFNMINQKVVKQIGFWKKFNLSLPGRINIAKTFLYSQINYLGCFLPFNENQLKVLSSLIENFVKGNLKISKTKIFESGEQGGLGLFKLDIFLASQCVAWVRRAHCCDEQWKRDLLEHSYGTVFNVRGRSLDEKIHPILHHIAVSYENLLINFTKRNENFMKAYVYENPALRLDANNPAFLGRGFFSDVEHMQYGGSIRSLTLDKIINADKTLKSKQEFQNLTGIQLSDIKYNKLTGIARTAIQTYTKNVPHEKKTDTLQNFCMRIRKGSKKYRKIITPIETVGISSNIRKFSEKIDLIADDQIAIKLNSLWTKSFFENNMRTFLFKLHNNQLGLNSRVAHFVRDHPSTCTFCDIGQVGEEFQESTSHLFYDCMYVEQCITDFYQWALGEPIGKRSFFFGINDNNETKNLLYNITSAILKKYIWDCKLRFTLPDTEVLKTIFILEIKKIIELNKKVKNFIQNNNIFIHVHF